MELRPGQREVAAYRGGYLAVPAIPGAGKTTVLSWLAANLIREGLPRGSKVLIVTVMNSAVANFSQRISQHLRNMDLPSSGFEVRTLHSLALQIIRQRPDAAGLRDDFLLLDANEREQLLDDLVRRWTEGNWERWHSLLNVREGSRSYEAALNGWRRKTRELATSMIPVLKELDSLPQPGEGMLAWAVEIYRDYCKELTRLGMLDFDDLLLKACRLVEEDLGLCQRLSQSWPYIFEDEAQDSNPIQQRLLLKLSQAHGNLVRVGDSNQAILGTFTNADPQLFRDFCRRPDVLRQEMLYASRSSQDIINLANHLVRWCSQSHPVAACRRALEETYIKPAPPGDKRPNPVPIGYTIGVRAYPNYQAEIAGVAQHAAEYAQRSPERTVAILAPTNNMVGALREQLEEMGARWYEITTYPANRRKTIDDLRAILAFLAAPGSNRLLLEAVGRLMAMELEKAVAGYLETARLELLFYGEPAQQRPVILTTFESWPELSRQLDLLRRWLDSCHLPPDRLILEIAQDLALQEQELAIAQKMAMDVKFRLTMNPSWRLPQVAEEVARLTRAFQGAANVFYERSGYTPEAGVVNLVTAHKAKGLEWDTVYVIGLTAGQYPGLMEDKVQSEAWFLPEEIVNPEAVAKAELKGFDPVDARIHAKEELLAERLRLLYVAITRAKLNLLLTWHRVNEFGGKTRQALTLAPLEQFIREEGRTQ